VSAAFGGWDSDGAKSFGYKMYWVNRFHLPMEELGPVCQIASVYCNRTSGEALLWCAATS
jgi:hypothetical protein